MIVGGRYEIFIARRMRANPRSSALQIDGMVGQGAKMVLGIWNKAQVAVVHVPLQNPPGKRR